MADREHRCVDHFIRCPHCKNEQHQIDDEDLPWDDGEVEEFECWNCEKWFQVRAASTIEHYVARPDEEEDCG